MIAILANGKPLSYGKSEEPYPGQLALRGRVDTFKNKEVAEECLVKSLLREDRLGSTWHKTVSFTFADVTCTCR